jgi:hypothetical protein
MNLLKKTWVSPFISQKGTFINNKKCKNRSVDLEASTVEIRDLFYNEIVKLIKLNNPSFEPSTLFKLKQTNNKINHPLASLIMEKIWKTMWCKVKSMLKSRKSKTTKLSKKPYDTIWSFLH